MSLRIFLLLSLIFAFLQGAFFPQVLIEGVLVVGLVLFTRPQKAFPGLLLGGIIFDLVQNQILGVTSSIFITFAFVLVLIKNDIPVQKPLVAASLATILTIVRAKLVFGSLFLTPAIVGGIIMFLLLIFTLAPVVERGSVFKLNGKS